MDFKQLAQDIDITDVARLLGVKLSKDMRAECCDSDRALQIYPETNSFCCHSSKTAGDCISMYAHLKGYQGMYKAAKELEEHFRTTGSAVASTAPEAVRAEPTAPKKRDTPFDPVSFWETLSYSDEVKALEISESDASRFWIGGKRGKVYQAMRDEFGFVAGYSEFKDGVWKFPPNPLANPSVVKLKRA